jgi:hypothetical protein
MNPSSLSPIKPCPYFVFSSSDSDSSESEEKSACPVSKKPRKQLSFSEFRPKHEGDAEEVANRLFQELISAPAICSTDVYVACNELEIDQTLAKIDRLKDDKKAVYVGFSCNFNFSAIAKRRPSVAFICDINVRTQQVVRFIISQIKQSAQMADFKLQFHAHLLANAKPYFAFTQLDEAKKYVDEEVAKCEKQGAWLTSEEDYQFLRQLALKGAIHYLNLDMTDTVSLIKLRDWIDTQGKQLDLLYLSNVPEWVKRSHFKKHQKMLSDIKKFIGHDKVLIVDAILNNYRDAGPTQRIYSYDPTS